MSERGEAVAATYRELTCTYPRPGWVECDGELIWSSVVAVCEQALSAVRLRADDLRAVGITNQRSSVIAWDRQTLRPIHPVISWQDIRTASRAAELVRQGLFTNAMASAAKIEWLLAQVPGAREASAGGHLCAGTVDTWLTAKLSGGEVFATDDSNASCTTLYDHGSGDWNAHALDVLAIPRQALAAIRASSEVYGLTSRAVFGAEVPIAAIAGDQQAAMFGELGVTPGATKITLGTSGMLDINVGDAPMLSSHGGYPLVLWRMGERRTYCLEGTVITVGAAIQWLRDGLGILGSVEESGAIAEQARDSGGVWFVPALQGLGTPHMSPRARAAFGGITRATGRAQIVRAVLEGIAFRAREVFEALVEDSGGRRPATLRADGGAAANDELLQLIADSIGVAVERPASVQASALGVAYLSGLATGVWSSVDELRRSWRSGGIFEPRTTAEERDSRFERWRRRLAQANAMDGDE